MMILNVQKYISIIRVKQMGILNHLRLVIVSTMADLNERKILKGNAPGTECRPILASCRYNVCQC